MDSSSVVPESLSDWKQVADVPDAPRVETVGWLVEHQQLGRAQERRREPQPLAHAERVGAHRAVVDATQPDTIKGLGDARFASTPRSGRPRRIEQAQVSAARQMAVGSRTLDEPTDGREHLDELPRNRTTEDHDLAAGGEYETEQQPQQGRLPGAVRAEQSVAITLPDVQVDLLDGPHASVPLGEAAVVITPVTDDPRAAQPLPAEGARAPRTLSPGSRVASLAARRCGQRRWRAATCEARTRDHRQPRRESRRLPRSRRASAGRAGPAAAEPPSSTVHRHRRPLPQPPVRPGRPPCVGRRGCRAMSKAPPR